jgi:hypothetical protein
MEPRELKGGVGSGRRKCQQGLLRGNVEGAMWCERATCGGEVLHTFGFELTPFSIMST